MTLSFFGGLTETRSFMSIPHYTPTRNSNDRYLYAENVSCISGRME